MMYAASVKVGISSKVSPEYKETPNGNVGSRRRRDFQHCGKPVFFFFAYSWKTNSFFNEYVGTQRRACRRECDAFVSAKCIIFNLYPAHAILDAVATLASLATRYAVVVVVVVVFASFRNFSVIKGPCGERAAGATLSTVSCRNQPTNQPASQPTNHPRGRAFPRTLRTQYTEWNIHTERERVCVCVSSL